MNNTSQQAANAFAKLSNMLALIFILIIDPNIKKVNCLCVTEQVDNSTNYATNGDFELPYLGPNSWRFTTDQLYGWTSAKIEQGTGSIYNPRWGSNTQVIQLDTDMNQLYNQTLVLPKSKFSIKVSYAAREGGALDSSGIRIWWNGQVLYDVEVSTDYLIHTKTFLVQANQGNNYLILEGRGVSDAIGMSADNIIFNRIQSYNRVEVNGQCLCDTGYYDDMMHWSCQPCTNIDAQCTSCNYTAINSSSYGGSGYSFYCATCLQGYFSLGGTCTACSVIDPGCLNCSNDGLQCFRCDESENYFLTLESNTTINNNISFRANSTTCTLCTLDECLNCTSLFVCSLCNFTNNYFLNSSTSLCEPCDLEGCIICDSLIQCDICDQSSNYFLSLSSNSTNSSTNTTICELCSLRQCLNCSSLSSCSICNQTNRYFLNSSTSLCQLCNLVGCLTCDSLTQCRACDLASSYYLADANFSECSYCNGSLNMFINYTWQTCENCTLVGCVHCSSLQSCAACIQKQYYLDTTTSLCEPCSNIEGCLQCISATVCILCDASKQYKIDKAGKCLNCISCNCYSGGQITNIAVPELQYTQEECKTRSNLQQLSVAIGVLSYITMFLSLISVKIVGLELFGVLQLAYFNLADNQFVNLYLSPLLDWKYLNGFNVDFTSGSLVPPNVQAIGYNGSFLSNINIMFLVLLLQLAISALLMILGKKIPFFKKINRFLFQQLFITLFLFNSFNIAFSSGLHFKYARSDDTDYYELSTFAAVLGLGLYFLVLVMLQVTNVIGFGEFKLKFKENWVARSYIFISVIYRMCLGVYMAVSNEELFGTLIILGFSFSYIMYNFINLPFAEAYQNYRANLCHIAQLVILMVTNYYRSMRYNDDLEIKARIYAPAQMQLAMIVICVIASIVCLAYEIIQAIKQKLKEKKLNSRITIINQTYESLPNDRSGAQNVSLIES